MPQLFTLGELQLVADDGTLLSRRAKPLVLLTFLARRSPRAVSRSELASLLWGERDESRARHSLRQTLLELGKLVGDRIGRLAPLARQRHPVALQLGDARVSRGRL